MLKKIKGGEGYVDIDNENLERENMMPGDGYTSDPEMQTAKRNYKFGTLDERSKTRA